MFRFLLPVLYVGACVCINSSVTIDCNYQPYSDSLIDFPLTYIQKISIQRCKLQNKINFSSISFQTNAILDLPYNALTNIPNIISNSSVTQLNVSNNLLRNLNESSLKCYRKITILDISYNKIALIENNPFQCKYSFFY